MGGLENIEALSSSTNKLLYFYQNKTITGGFLGGLAGVELAKKMIRERNASGDLFVYPILLALIIGRVGCFTMGVYEETYGIETTFPLALNLGDGLQRHPVALYEIVFLLLLWLLIASIKRKVVFANGGMFKIFLISYLLFRFLLDFIKPHYTFSIGLSTIQIVCLLGIIYYYRYIFHPNLLLNNAYISFKKK